MKHLIIEGPDRVGKDTLIKNLTSHFSNVAIRHFRSPKGNDDSEKRVYQYNSFHEEYENVIDFNRMKFDLCIWNRGHLGEFVYGKLYRQTEPETWVLNQESMYIDKDSQVYLLLLTASPEFLASKDDGKSFSSTASARKQEIESFREACNKSKIPHFLEIKVEDDGIYLTPEDITQQVMNFLQK
jgi:thymidylate kinase